MFGILFVLVSAAFAQYLQCLPANPADVSCKIFSSGGPAGCQDSEIMVEWQPDQSIRNCTSVTDGTNTFYIKVKETAGLFQWFISPDNCTETPTSYGCGDFDQNTCRVISSGDFGSGSEITVNIRCDDLSTGGSTTTGTSGSTTGDSSGTNPRRSDSSSAAASMMNLFF